MAEWSKATDLSSVTRESARVRTPLPSFWHVYTFVSMVNVVHFSFWLLSAMFSGVARNCVLFCEGALWTAGFLFWRAMSGAEAACCDSLRASGAVTAIGSAMLAADGHRFQRLRDPR